MRGKVKKKKRTEKERQARKGAVRLKSLVVYSVNVAPYQVFVKCTAIDYVNDTRQVPFESVLTKVNNKI